MNSALYVGTLAHTRFHPTRHTFTYPVYFAAVDLDELPQLDDRCRLFGYNRARPFALRDVDYLGERGRDVKTNVVAWLADRGVELAGGQIRLVTNLRTFGYVFNPVSFLYCYRPDGELACAIADVRNTFGERRPYLLDAAGARTAERDMLEWHQPKQMHVSPFFPVDQRYRFALGDLGETALARVDVFDGADRVLSAVQRGERRPFTDVELARLAIRHPLMAQKVTGRIHRQALALWRKGVPFFRKPAFTPQRGSAVTTAEHTAAPAQKRTGLRPTPPAPRIPFPIGPVRAVVRWALGAPSGGRLRVIYPDLTETLGGDERSGRSATITIHGKDLYRRLVHRGRVSIGEAFVAGDWDADNLVDALEILLLTSEARRREAIGRRFTRLLELRPHLPRRNPPEPAKRDIQYHYDLGNDFYALFLDDGMNYSCAVFEGDETIEAAQLAKHRMICRKLQLGPNDHLLEIGCGWGGFAITAALEFGARVTGVTLSQEQHDEARARVAAVGLEDRISIELRDYRTLEGRFTKIASIEMFEAIGEAEYTNFFGACERLLAPDGLAYVQTIAMPDQRYERYRRTTDWIKEYIFPGSLLPSLSAITKAVTASSDLIVNDVEDIGAHYATTLRHWRERFEHNLDRVRAMGFDDEFIRQWRFYLASCEAAFRTRTIHDYQLLFTRPCNLNLR